MFNAFFRFFACRRVLKRDGVAKVIGYVKQVGKVLLSIFFSFLAFCLYYLQTQTDCKYKPYKIKIQW